MATLTASSSIAPALSLADHTIEVVHGRMTDERAEEIVAFWTREGALDEAAARERLREVVCVVRDRSGAIAGVNSVYAAKLDAVGGRPFWVYRSFLPRLGPEVW